MKTLESFLERVKSIGQAISWILRPSNVVEIHPSSMIMLPEKEESTSVLYVLELVTQPADRKLCIR